MTATTKTLRFSWVSLVAALLLLAGEAAAINMTWGDVRVRRLGSFAFTATNSQLSFDGGATDQLYQMYGYIGNADGMVAINGGSFDVDSAIAATGDTATSTISLDASGAAALGLTAGDIELIYTFTLIDDTSAADRDAFVWDIAVTNNSSTSQDLSIYTYLDLDLDGAGDYGDDLAEIVNGVMRVSDSDSPTEYSWYVESGGSGPDHFQIGSYPSVQNVLDAMTVAGDLSDGLASFGPGDFTGAYQFDYSLAAGESSSVVSIVPEPGAGLLVSLGLVGLAVMERRTSRRRA